MIQVSAVRFFAGVLLFVLSSSLSAGSIEKSSSLDLSAVPLNQFVNLYFKELTKRPYVVCNDVLSDTRLVSLRASGRMLDESVFTLLMNSYGYDVSSRDGVVYVCRESTSGERGSSFFFYRPKHREAAYLVDFVSPLVKGTFANKRSVGASLAVGGGSSTASSPVENSQVSLASSQSSQSGLVAYNPVSDDDYIVFSGIKEEVEKLQKLFAQIDIPAGEVVLRGLIYEVGKNESYASALDVFLSALGGKITFSSPSSTLGNVFRLTSTSLDVVASMLKSDGRFKVVTSPFARVRSGRTARFVVGSDVPVLGSIVTSQNGQTQQSIEYRSSGMIFEVLPRVLGESTYVELFQQVSSFVNTETGVNVSPTLNKREMRTSLTVEDGEVLVIGGLNDFMGSEAKNGLGFLPFSLSKSEENKSSELLLVLELKRI